jgi:hypothetical protein
LSEKFRCFARNPSFSEEEKSDAIHTLTSRPAYALALLQAVEKGRIPRGDLPAFAVRQHSNQACCKVGAIALSIMKIDKPSLFLHEGATIGVHLLPSTDRRQHSSPGLGLGCGHPQSAGRGPPYSPNRLTTNGRNETVLGRMSVSAMRLC